MTRTASSINATEVDVATGISQSWVINCYYKSLGAPSSIIYNPSVYFSNNTVASFGSISATTHGLTVSNVPQSFANTTVYILVNTYDNDIYNVTNRVAVNVLSMYPYVNGSVNSVLYIGDANTVVNMSTLIVNPSGILMTFTLVRNDSTSRLVLVAIL